jgi:hypothetical protein
MFADTETAPPARDRQRASSATPDERARLLQQLWEVVDGAPVRAAAARVAGGAR